MDIWDVSQPWCVDLMKQVIITLTDAQRRTPLLLIYVSLVDIFDEQYQYPRRYQWFGNVPSSHHCSLCHLERLALLAMAIWFQSSDAPPGWSY
jgi:hypothetical protein